MVDIGGLDDGDSKAQGGFLCRRCTKNAASARSAVGLGDHACELVMLCECKQRWQGEAGGAHEHSAHDLHINTCAGWGKWGR